MGALHRNLRDDEAAPLIRSGAGLFGLQPLPLPRAIELAEGDSFRSCCPTQTDDDSEGLTWNVDECNRGYIGSSETIT